MTAQTAETARQVADIIDFRPDEFHMANWERRITHCRTTRCIAGWVSFLAGESLAVMTFSDGLPHEFHEQEDWIQRQGERLGLDNDAAHYLFIGIVEEHPDGTLLSNLLRDIAKETEDRANLIEKHEVMEMEWQLLVREANQGDTERTAT